MYVNVAVLKETRPHERRVALVPSVVPKLTKLGAKLHMQKGAGDAIKLTDAAFEDVAIVSDRNELVADADVVLAVQPPALEVIDAMKEGAILMSFIYADKEPALVQRLLDKKITCFAMESCRASRGRNRWTRCPASPRWPDITPCSSARRIWAASCRRSRRLPAPSDPPKCWSWGSVSPGWKRLRPRIAWAPSPRGTMFAPRRRNRPGPLGRLSSRPASMPAARAAMRAN